MFKRLLRDRRLHRVTGLLLVLAVAAMVLAWQLGWDLAVMKAAWRQVEIYLMDRPWLLFAVLVVLPGLPVPTSALLVLAATVWRDHPLVACAVCLLALALNMTWTYWLAARPGRGLVEKLLETSSVRIPALPQGNHLRIILIMRLTPGFPLFLQNYTLGFLRVPFRLYLFVSLGCSGLIASGVVLSTAGVADGNLTIVLAGLPVLVLGMVVVQWIRARLAAAQLKSRKSESLKV